MRYEARRLDQIAARLGTSTAALEQYLQLKQREADPPKVAPSSRSSRPARRPEGMAG